jgi:hypothetical protein
MSDIARTIGEKVTFANFLKYFGPGLILYWMARLAGMGYSLNLGSSSAVDSAAIVMVFLVLGLSLNQLYRAFFLDRFLCRLKDGIPGRKWENYRDRLRKVCPERKLSSRDAEWIWGQLRKSRSADAYGRSSDTSSAIVYLLYFTGLSLMIAAIAGGFVCAFGWLVRCVFGYLSMSVASLASGVLSEAFGFAILGGIGLIVFVGGLLSDRALERQETYSCCPADEELKRLIEPVLANPAFSRPSVTAKGQ